MEETRKCQKCKVEKELNEENFKRKVIGDPGFTKRCLNCIAVCKKYYDNNREEIIRKDKENRDPEKKKEWERRNRDKRNQQAREWYKNNPEKIKEKNERLSCNEHNKVYCVICDSHREITIQRNLIVRMSQVFHKRDMIWDVSKFNLYLGCNISNVVEYLDNLMKKRNFTWDNYGCEKDNWQIDHIKPLDPDKEITDKEFLKKLHYENLQPLTITENSIKSNTEVDELEKLFKENL